MISIVPLAPGARSPIVQVYSSPEEEVGEGVELTNVVSAGIVSTTSTNVAQPVPEFSYTIVYTSVSPGSASDILAVLVRDSTGAVTTTSA